MSRQSLVPDKCLLLKLYVDKSLCLLVIYVVLLLGQNPNLILNKISKTVLNFIDSYIRKYVSQNAYAGRFLFQSVRMI